ATGHGKFIRYGPRPMHAAPPNRVPKVRLLRVTNAPSRKPGLRERCCTGRLWVRMVAAFSELAGQRGGGPHSPRVGHQPAQLLEGTPERSFAARAGGCSSVVGSAGP